jgi:hypothetical protein
MNGFLVLLVHTMDDLPIGLFMSDSAAMSFANEIDEMPTEKIRKVYGTDCSTPNCVKIVQFDCGEPVAVRVVRTFDN